MKQNSMLLQLPNELLQIITKHMDAGTFFASLLTSKRFLEVALSRSLLFHHLNRIPGLTLGITDLSTPDLLSFFKKRAAQSGCAAGALANITKYTHQFKMSSAVFILSSDPSQPGNFPQLVTTQWDGVLQIYDLAEDHVRRRVELHIRPEGGCSDTRVEILKLSVSPSSRDLAILYRQKEHSRYVSPFRKRSESGCDSDVYRLVTFHRCFARTLGYFYDSSVQETRDITEPEDHRPVGLTLASNGNACIAWKSPDRLNKTKICLVRRNEKIMVCDFPKQFLLQWNEYWDSKVYLREPKVRFSYEICPISQGVRCTEDMLIEQIRKGPIMVSEDFLCKLSFLCIKARSASHC